MIARYFTRQVEQYRSVYTDGKSSLVLIDTFSCYIEQNDSENQIFDTSYSKSYNIYTDITRNVKEADVLIYNGIDFIVKGFKYYNIGRNKHLEITCQKNDDTNSFISL